MQCRKVMPIEEALFQTKHLHSNTLIQKNIPDSGKSEKRFKELFEKCKEAERRRDETSKNHYCR